MCCIAIIIWFLTTNTFYIFRSRSKKIITEKEEEEHPDIYAINFNNAIETAIQQSNYGLAVRWLYLQLLKNMADVAIINFGQEKPNSAYLYQLQSTPFYKDFHKLTLHFEYAWYGKFFISDTMFSKIKSDFESFTNHLPA